MSRLDSEQFVWDAAMKIAASDTPVGIADVHEAYIESCVQGVIVTWGEALRLPIMVESLRDADRYGNRGWTGMGPKFYRLQQYAEKLERS